MDNILSDLQENELLIYMDDAIIYEIKLDKLMKRLEAANFKLQPDKYEFLRKEVLT